MMSDYQEEVARMRMERKQAEAADQYEQLRQQYNEAVENRENASLQILGNDGDRSEWDYWDSQVEDAERQLAPYMRPPPPDPRAARWDWQNQSYINKVNQRIGPSVQCRAWLTLMLLPRGTTRATRPATKSSWKIIWKCTLRGRPA